MERKADNREKKNDFQQRAYYLNLVENAQYAFLTFNLPTGKFEYVSSSIRQITGYSAKEVFCMGVYGFYERVSAKHQCDVGDFFNNSKKQSHKPVYTEISFNHKKGHYIWLGIDKNVIRDNKGKALAIALIRDITAIKRCQEQLESLKTLYDNSQVGIYRTRISDGKMLECNQSMVRMLGYKNREQCLNQHYSMEFYAEPKQREELLRLAKQIGKVDNFEVQARRIDGSPLWMKISVQTFDEKGYIEGAIWDITMSKILTKTENQILKEIMLGKSSKEIAYQVKRSIRTIEDHRGSIMRKLGVHNLVELTKKVMEASACSPTC